MSKTVWILKPKDDRETTDEPDPWQPWYDKCFGMVIRAETETQARVVAQEAAKDETTISPVHHNVDKRVRDRKVWTDESLTICIPIEEYEPERNSKYATDNRVLIQDVAHA